MDGRLTEAQRDCYQSDGILFPVRVLTAGEAAEHRRACDDLEARLGGKPRTIEVRQMHLHFAWAHRLATHPAILDAYRDSTLTQWFAAPSPRPARTGLSSEEAAVLRLLQRRHFSYGKNSTSPD